MAQTLAAPAPAAPSKDANVSAQVSAKEARDDRAASQTAGQNEVQVGQSAETVVIAPAPGTIETETAEIRTKDESKKVQKKAAGALAVSNLKAAFQTAPSWSLSPAGALQRSFDAGKTWQTIPVAANVIFRAFAANASDVWAGGAGGALYHSSNAGQTWTQVTPADNGQSLTADIISVEFPNPQTGKLATSANETWTTTDAGLTWHRN
jgi:photosystem II stability/assembly factor-like uncharacterized protein